MPLTDDELDEAIRSFRLPIDTPGLQSVVGILKRGERNDDDVALWFMSHNSFLGGHRPVDEIMTDPDRVARAAEDEVIGIQHG